jgi:hypothetical protein
MYRILPKRLIFIGFAWIVIGLLTIAYTLPQITNWQLRLSTIPALAWFGLNALLFNPIWRFFWRKFPKLNKWVFPDLNGHWDVELCSNWPRQLQLLEAASSPDQAIDLRTCPESLLAEMKPIKLRAEISQTWWSFEMKMYNPKGDTPIDRSDTISVDPFPGNGLKPPGICYFYKQVNATDNVSDDSEFFGAARLTYDFENDELAGLAWTARMWRRAMNTAGPIKFIRCGGS